MIEQGLSKLVQWVLDQINKLIPIVAVHQFQNAVLYEFGRFKKVLYPGWHFKIPYINTIVHENVVDTTVLLPAQSVRSQEGTELLVRGVVGYRVVDVNKYLNNVYDTKSAISDNAFVLIRDICALSSVSFIEDVELKEILKAGLQNDVKDYGVIINFIALGEISRGRTYKFFNENIKLES